MKLKNRVDLSIITVSFNTCKVLLDCLASVYGQTEGISFEVIVVDNDSSDDTLSTVSKKFPDREEAGTPNILGAITLGSAIHVLDSIGMDIILKKDLELTNYAIDRMKKYPDIFIYGNIIFLQYHEVQMHHIMVPQFQLIM